MLFRFDANQDFQLAAIEAVARLFEGQPHVEPDLEFKLGFASIGNRLDLDEAALLWNLQAVQRDNGLKADQGLEAIESEPPTDADERRTAQIGEDRRASAASQGFYNFSVEMETGTGKTYV